MTHPAASIDDVVHQRTRLGVLAILRESIRIDFCALRDELGVTDGNLSQHLRVLEDASYVEMEKGYEGRRPRTWARATPAGNEALGKELELLSRIMEASGYASPAQAIEMAAALEMAGAARPGVPGPVRVARRGAGQLATHPG
jgi:DNA-binding MarR family transcriptional regulator